MNALANAKDWMMQHAARVWINSQRGRFGTMTKLQIDSKKHAFHCELDLKGETTAIIVDGCYAVANQDGRAFIELTGIQTSREWLNVVLDDHMKQVRFEVPNMIKLVL
jgi:hypothetical protein